MTKFFLLIGVILPAFISAATAAGPVSKSWFTVEQNDPESEVVLRVSIPEPEVSVITVGHGQRTVISLPDCGQLLEEGEPALPFVSAFVQISAGRDVILEAEPLTSTVRQLAAPVLPAGGPDADLADCAVFEGIRGVAP